MYGQTTNIVQLLKKSGLRVTPQREAILQFLMDYQGHATVDDIYQSVHPTFPSMSVSTVYNTVKNFAQLGLVKEITVGDGPSRFDINVKPHHHLVCIQCGALIDFYMEEQPKFQLPPEATGFEIEDYHVEVKGICPACREKSTNQ
ncbi:transcriptional repressor [Alicyclobacillus hesperidum subsp. aegles]|uniref:Fur family transcriptional regulator n=1 Tax=Alicyclobacillus hesperidum TaxID=89784 RepID=UPI00222BB9EA|nr:Fur family transcriptional regulator [Alicyclobacillus hesperidum]GLG02799.1 transcriptional repressor [Alicyclobacillus hesperidum subsp. aegles]